MFPLTPGDIRLVEQLTRQKNEALAFVGRCEALMADVPEDNPFLGASPMSLRSGREEVVNGFINRIARLLSEHYQCDINTWDLLKDRPHDCDAEAVLTLAVQELKGQSVAEAARDKIRAVLVRCTGRQWTIQGRKVTIPRLLYFQEHFDHRYSLPTGQIDPLINALACWSTGALYADWRLWSLSFPRFPYAPAADWFRAYPTPLTAIESLRYFKNGRVDVTFGTAEQAQDFVAQFGPAAEARPGSKP
ncbi:hypothetical protein [Sulfobacillus harzensis]|uniref:Uncharacterized protein n=1 Tax=Sulfobacillus harzensis TaxID=2729629 RepID=A0A7Y0L6X2_9FIRM|nr:hypothetical protein [Sulfobacillus harzensis]NMP24402.1 hypothetical protein [Sulfobacillus harzensis]